MQTERSTLVYRHTRLGILTEQSPDVVDLTEGLGSLLADAALTRGLVNLRSFANGTRIVVTTTGAAPAWSPDAATLGTPLAPNQNAVTTVPIVDGHLQLGARERVLLIDLEGPGAREIAVVMVGEARR